MITIIPRLRFALLGIIFTLLGCSPKSGEQVIRPVGWVKETIQAQPSGVKVLFAGKRPETAAVESHLVVLHAAAMNTKQKARGTIGAFLDGFWKKDPKMFKAIKVAEAEIAGRHALYVQLFGDAMNPPQQGKLRVYFFMTDAGVYEVTYSTEGEAIFKPDEFLRDSFVIEARESNFALDVIADYVKNTPEIQAKRP